MLIDIWDGSRYDGHITTTDSTDSNGWIGTYDPITSSNWVPGPVMGKFAQHLIADRRHTVHGRRSGDQVANLLLVGGRQGGTPLHPGSRDGH